LIVDDSHCAAIVATVTLANVTVRKGDISFVADRRVVNRSHRQNSLLNRLICASPGKAGVLYVLVVTRAFTHFASWLPDLVYCGVWK
jgi:hypothetical protein